MKRNTTTLFLQSSNSTTPIPWVNNAPDFTGITEPTLSILQAAWEAGKDNIEIIPDPEPIPEIKNPDWEGLVAEVLGGDLLPLFTCVTAEAINSNPISIARNDINLAVTVIKNEQALASSLALLQQCGFVFTNEKKQLWNTTLQELGFGKACQL